ncbi:hypothetical protein ABTX81_17810 [Kitasatospora sp. NPDC097605]|uniref:hypothetical protein n=1 Tax=Kitasatospora sp. NPDC097605 TaxID=3157226 RepID=UPI00331E6F5B
MVLGAAAPRTGGRRLLPLVPAAAAGACAAWAAVHWATDAHDEAALLRGTCAGLLTTLALCALLDTTRKPVDALP